MATPSASVTEGSNSSSSGPKNSSIMTSVAAERTDANSSMSLKRIKIKVKLPPPAEATPKIILSKALFPVSPTTQKSSNLEFAPVVSPPSVAEQRQETTSSLFGQHFVTPPSRGFTEFEFSSSDPPPRINNHQNSNIGNYKLFGPSSTTTISQGPSTPFLFTASPPKTVDNQEKAAGPPSLFGNITPSWYIPPKTAGDGSTGAGR